MKTYQPTFPPKYRRIVDAVMDQDKQYFTVQPAQAFYVRKLVDGEFWPFKFDGGVVKVIKRDETTRVRIVLGHGPRSLYPGKRARLFVQDMSKG